MILRTLAERAVLAECRLVAMMPAAALVVFAWTAPLGAASPPQPQVDWARGVAYKYDGSGNIRRIGPDVYVYDHFGRVVKADVNRTLREYTYDAFGNRLTCTQAAGTPLEGDCQGGYQIDEAANRNRVAGLPYDQRGNLESFESHNYHYDALNMMTREEFGAARREFIYTADDERIAIHDVSSSSFRWTIRDVSGKVLREFTSGHGENGAGSGELVWSRDFIWRDALLLASRQPVNGSVTTYHYHLDHLGTPRQVTDQTDQLVGFHDYYPFGHETDGGKDEPNAAPLKFTGHERDTWGGSSLATLDYMHARYYSATLGRFLSVDPTWESADLAAPQSWNRYSYVRNNPINNTDPDGRICIPCAAVGALGAVAYESYRQVKSGEPVNNARLLAAVGIGAAVGAGVGAVAPIAYNAVLANPAAVATGTTVAAGALTPGPEQIGAAIGAKVAGMASGKMSAIAGEISGMKMTQDAAATAVDTAVQAMGLRTTGVVKVGDNLVVGSVQVGANKPVMVVDAQGAVRQANATIEVTKKYELIIKDIEYR